MAVPFKGQKFDRLRKAQLSLGVLYTDPTFPPSDTSLFLSTRRVTGKIQWKRPGEICSDPKLFEGGISRVDVFQGQLGNCWFVAACSVLAGVKEFWHKVIPDYKEQEWDPENPAKYSGIFHFRFWRFGKWVDVVIDDLLPTVNGKLIFTHSQSKNEFWCALLEKAYAKVNGCYESLDGGNLSDALVDFTSGISETMDISSGGYSSDEEKRKDLFKMLLKHKDNYALMCCAVAAPTKADMEVRTSVGLIKGHAYGITAIRKVNLKDTRLFAFLRGREKINMVRLRNPWGEKEWSGSFSDGLTGPSGEGYYVYSAGELTRLHSRSPEWSRISSSERERLGLTFEEDGEFWMTFDDFVMHFTEISVCHLLNTSVFTFSRRWYGSVFYGGWTSGVRGSAADRAGGCVNHRESFLRNPQYCFDIESEGEEIVIQLSQPDVRERRRQGAENIVIGLHILKVEDNRKYRLHTMLESAGHSDYIKTRSVILRTQNGPGRYILLPTTFKPGQNGEYLLRFFSTCKANLRELKLDVPESSLCPCVRYPSCVTSVTVRKITGLQKIDTFGSSDPYCIIKCEGHAVRSKIVKNTLDAVWNISAVFYRKQMNKDILIEVWNSNAVIDTFMGQVEFPAAPSNGDRKGLAAPLKGRGNTSQNTLPGKLSIEYQTEDDLHGI